MNILIDNEVNSILNIVSGEQESHRIEHGFYKKITETNSDLSGLSYCSLNYFNEQQGIGYGILFKYVSGETGIFDKGIDVGFYDPDFIISGQHHVSNFDWTLRPTGLIV